METRRQKLPLLRDTSRFAIEWKDSHRTFVVETHCETRISKGLTFVIFRTQFELNENAKTKIQDGATSHTARKSLVILKEMFPGCLISGCAP